MALDVGGTVLLVGAGKMGLAMLEGWLAQGLPAADIVIQEPNPSSEVRALAAHRGIAIAGAASPSVHPLVIVAAVKPQVMDVVFGSVAKNAGPETVILSIAAGRSIASFEKHLRQGAAVVRAMPNTPAAIGRGITGAVANGHVTAAQKATCNALLEAVGEVVWVDNEALIDAVTAVSGSGPAYVFWLAECLTDAGVAAGLDRQAASALARATVSGAGELLRLSPLDAAKLRENVTSPGGTTAAALSVLMRDKDGLRNLMTEAVRAAQKRSRELGA